MYYCVQSDFNSNTQEGSKQQKIVINVGSCCNLLQVQAQKNTIINQVHSCQILIAFSDSLNLQTFSFFFMSFEI